MRGLAWAGGYFVRTGNLHSMPVTSAAIPGCCGCWQSAKAVSRGRPESALVSACTSYRAGLVQRTLEEPATSTGTPWWHSQVLVLSRQKMDERSTFCALRSRRTRSASTNVARGTSGDEHQQGARAKLGLAAKSGDAGTPRIRSAQREEKSERHQEKEDERKKKEEPSPGRDRVAKESSHLPVG